jgi:hypothetical protein
MTNRPFSTWVRTKPTAGATRVRWGLGRTPRSTPGSHCFQSSHSRRVASGSVSTAIGTDDQQSDRPAVPAW